MSIICNMLKEMKYDVIDDDDKYSYLVNMPMSSIIEENIDKLENERDKKIKELEKLIKTNVSKMWIDELIQLKYALAKKKIKLVKSP